ncbi:DUF596 domain-containing protein [Leucobacter viscericola]|uniref:DUF596 domain-containing protein n=1 Tax=Leucobacter viscericola TaxID=2714935 RepID=A0A6G7XDD8_9MICO|nr:DUF596 domain-containing protein [Leucobacter viscericola]QIK62563.1 DUF596 domain-containing protein [Leucobacter viscericola]
MTRFTAEQLLWLHEGEDDGDLYGIWFRFNGDTSGIEPPLINPPVTFEERREAFLDLLTVFLEKGYLRFAWQWEEGEPFLNGRIAEQIRVLRDAMPDSDEEILYDGNPLWFITTCPIDVVWRWPGRDPEPLFPGHNPRYDYIEPRAYWDGRIDPEWSHWKFTPGRLHLDDFSSEEEASAFWKAHPNYFQTTPRIERIIE